MNIETNFSSVAKFGGTSMAQPNRVFAQLQHPDNNCQVVVVSAPGTDDSYSQRMTQMLIEYDNRRDASKLSDIQERFAGLAQNLTSAENEANLWEVVEKIPMDIVWWLRQEWPIKALGEYWSAKLFSAYSGREFVDARELIFFDQKGRIDHDTTTRSVQNRLASGGSYVVPGFYGMGSSGEVRTFGFGGSDITGAILAVALGVKEYHNWSDVDGFMSADPNLVSNARLLQNITYREARELANGGSELLHRTAIEILGRTGIVTVMRNTLGILNNRGTIVSDSRDWQDSPVIAVSSRDDLIELSLHEFGLNEQVGSTAKIYDLLKRHRVAYEHTATATDDVSVFIATEYRKVVELIARKLRTPHNQIRVSPAGMVHVVGEGLAQSSTIRFRTLGAVAGAFTTGGIEGMGMTDVARSVATTLFIEPSMVRNATQTAHDTLELYAEVTE